MIRDKNRATDKKEQLGDFLVKAAEGFLTRRARKRYIQAQKAKRRGIILDWLMALLWAVIWVFIINQFLVQAYIIPSGSMIPTLKIGDRIFVNKLIYGPEILPEIGKIPSPVKPKRGDIIIFQSPEYYSAGPVFKIAHRLIYMISLSLIDIDPNVQLLIKRGVGFDGDQIIMRNGDFYIKARGEKDFIKETEFIALSNLHYTPRRLLPESEYENSKNSVIYNSYASNGIELPFYLEYLKNSDGQAFFSDRIDESRIRYDSMIYERYQLQYQFYPWHTAERASFYRQHLGIYVPDGYLLPLGDNRDDSKDGRFWGVVKQKEVLGKALWRFYPFDRRWGAIR
jgi:signal peptidase I